MTAFFSNIITNYKLKSFYSDKLPIHKQFKALYRYGKEACNEDRKLFHEKNYGRVFSVCRCVLDYYAHKTINTRSRKPEDYITNVCQIIEALTRLCKDIPYLIKQHW
eukprot:318818_1